MTVSDYYRRQLMRLHETKPSFGTKAQYKGLDTWIEKHNPISLIDYGCGKGKLLESLVEKYKFTGIGYDPGVKEFMAMPKYPADLLVSTDVLEHIEPAHIEEVLEQIDSLFIKSAWLLIDTREAIKVLPDGRNAHLIIEDQEWWTDKVSNHLTGKIVVNSKQKQDKILIVVDK